MKFYLQDDTSRKVDEIIKRLKKLMDGDVSSQMKNHGLDYQLNYGASILWLRNVAKLYKGDNQLADRLWNREIRETMILATMIADQVPDNKKRIEEWVRLIQQNEIAEQLGVNLLWRITDFTEVATVWLLGDQLYLRDAVWAGLAVFLQRGGELDVAKVNRCLDIIAKNLDTASPFTMRVQGRFLRQLCRKSECLMSQVDEFIHKQVHISHGAWLFEDVQTEIQFLKGVIHEEK